MKQLINWCRSGLPAALWVLATLLPFAASAATSAALRQVPNSEVCMVTDSHFTRKQIPVEVENKTYYGCCENCKATLNKDANVRFAKDPLTGEKVDKATAVIAAFQDDSVLYFANAKNFKAYQEKTKPTPR